MPSDSAATAAAPFPKTAACPSGLCSRSGGDDLPLPESQPCHQHQMFQASGHLSSTSNQTMPLPVNEPLRGAFCGRPGDLVSTGRSGSGLDDPPLPRPLPREVYRAIFATLHKRMPDTWRGDSSAPSLDCENICDCAIYDSCNVPPTRLRHEVICIRYSIGNASGQVGSCD